MLSGGGRRKKYGSLPDSVGDVAEYETCGRL
jgi:hypothetical protein